MNKLVLCLPTIGYQSDYYHKLVDGLNLSTHQAVPLATAFPVFPESFTTSVITGHALHNHGVYQSLLYDALLGRAVIPQRQDIVVPTLWDKWSSAEVMSLVLNWPGTLGMHASNTLSIAPEFFLPLGQTADAWPVIPDSVSDHAWIDTLIDRRMHPSDLMLEDFEELECFEVIQQSPLATRYLLLLISHLTSLVSVEKALNADTRFDVTFVYVQAFDALAQLLKHVEMSLRTKVADELLRVILMYLQNLATSYNQVALLGSGVSFGEDCLKGKGFLLIESDELIMVNVCEDIFAVLCDWGYATRIEHKADSGLSQATTKRLSELNVDALVNISESLRSRNNVLDTLEPLRKAFDLAPENKLVQFRLLQSLIETGLFDEAKRVLATLHEQANGYRLCLFFETMLALFDNRSIEIPDELRTIELPEFLQAQLISMLLHVDDKHMTAALIAWLGTYISSPPLVSMFNARFFARPDYSPLDTASFDDVDDPTLIEFLSEVAMNNALKQGNLAAFFAIFK